MSQTLEEIRQYWNSRAEGYTLSSREELEDTSHLAVWKERAGGASLPFCAGCGMRTRIFLDSAGKDGV